LILATVVFALPAWAQSSADFSGTWRQSNERSQPSRKGDVTLKIDHHDPELTVETSAQRGSSAPRRVTQRYTTDGKVSVTTGIDGDEFHTSVVWNNQSLIFAIEEHEDGRILLSQETWTLIDDGAALERVRERRDGSDRQVVVYLRQTPKS
jgi:hypothetical protein